MNRLAGLSVLSNHHGHIAVIFAGRRYGDFHVLAENCQELHQPAGRKTARAIAHEERYEKTMIVSKLRGARQRMKTKTGRCEGRRPFGYYAGETAILVRMKALRETGMSFDRVAEVLNAEGLKPRTGVQWWGKTVSNILSAQWE